MTEDRWIYYFCIDPEGNLKVKSFPNLSLDTKGSP